MLAAGLCIVSVLAGCAHQGPDVRAASQAAADSAGAPTGPAVYHIGPDDRLQVNVWRNPDLSVLAPVRPDGMISVPLIGDVRAGGRTPEQVATDIEHKLATYVREPKVTVIVTELNSNAFLSRVRVTGAVQRPISIPYRQGMTVLDVVLEAGGVTEFAAPNRTHLYRRVAGETQVYAIQLDDILTRGQLDSNLSLRPGDVISIPERLF